MQGRLERLPQVLVLLRGEDVRLVHDRATDRVPELERPVGGDDPHRAGAVRIDELVSPHAHDVEERARLDEGAGEVEDDPRLLPRAGGAEDVRGVAPGQELVQAEPGRERRLPVPARHAEDAEAVDAPALLVALVELVHEGALPVLELERSPGRRPLRVDEVGGEEVCDRSAVAAVQDRARLSSLVQLRLLGEGDGDEALLVGRGRRPVGRLQPGEVGIIDERAEQKAGVAVGAEAAVAQMLLQGFGRPCHGYASLVRLIRDSGARLSIYSRARIRAAPDGA